MFLCSAFRYLNASSSPNTCTSVAIAVYAVPEALGFAICTSPANSGLIRSLQQAGAASFFFASSSVL